MVQSVWFISDMMDMTQFEFGEYYTGCLWKGHNKSILHSSQIQ